MIEFTKTICIAVLFAISWSSTVRSENLPPHGVYTGGGYQVETGNGGDYIGYDRQGRKLVISSNPLTYGKTAEWKNQGYTYRLTGIGNSLAGSSYKIRSGEDDAGDSTVYKKVMLTIINPQGRVILNQVLNEVR